MKKILAWATVGLLLGIALGGAPSATMAQDGGKIYTDKCLPCHGEKGDGKGPLAVTFDPKPGSFGDAKFCTGDVHKKITDAVTKGKNQMVPVDLKPDEIKAVCDYITKTFKK
jgi:mono/diheme cytochrome c family protein